MEVIPFSELAQDRSVFKAAGVDLGASRPAPAAEISFADIQSGGDSISADDIAHVDTFYRRPKDELFKDDAFDPRAYFVENPDVAKDPAQLQKLLDVYRGRRERGLTAGAFKEAAKAAVPTGVKFVKGAGKLASNVFEFTGLQSLFNEAASVVTGDAFDTQRSAALAKESDNRATKALAEFQAGTELSATGISDLGRTGVRKIFGKSVKDLTDQELLAQLSEDASFQTQLSDIQHGRGEGLKAAGLDADTLAKQGIELDPEAIENLSLVDPATVIATAGLFKVVGTGGKLLATAGTRAAAVKAAAALNTVAKTVVGKTVQGAGKVVTGGAKAAGVVAEIVPAEATGAVLGAAKGGPLGAVAGAVSASRVQAGLVKGAEKLAEGGRRVSELGREIAGEIPRSAGLEKIYGIAGSPIVKGTVGGAVVGTAAAAPLALLTDDDVAAGGILGGGAILGTTAGAVLGGKTAIGEFAAKRQFDPHGQSLPVVDSPAYGLDPALDTTHAKQLQLLSPNEQGAVTTFREAVRGLGGEMYVVDAPTFKARIADEAVRRKGSALSPQEQAAIDAAADHLGVFDGTVPGADGASRRVVFLNGDAKAVPHESGHLFHSLLSPAAQDGLRASVREFYTPEQLADFQARYEQRLGAKISPDAAIDELVAENFSALFNNVPVTELTAPKGFLSKLGAVAAEGAEALGIDLTGGRRTPDLQAPVSHRLRKIFENAAREVVEAGKLAEPPPPATPAPTPAPTSAPTPAPTPGVRNIRVTSGQQDAFAKRAAETGVTEAKQLAAADPAVAARVNEVSASMEAGNPVLEIEHLGIKSPGAPGTPEGRTSRRGTQAAGYEELARIQADNRANAPESVVNTHQKTFVPVRWTNQGGTPTLVAMSLDKVISNTHRIAKSAADHNASGLIPYPTEAGKLTEAGWNQVVADARAYAENQHNGFRGDGQRLTRPTEDVGLSIPAENPDYRPTLLDPAKADFHNLIQGLATPETAREVKGAVPGNIKGQVLAEANKRTTLTPADIKPKNAGKQSFASFPGRSLKEVNPLRNALVEKGVPVRELIEVTERIRAKDIASVKPRPDINFKAPVTDIIRGGFLPQSDNPRAIKSPAMRDSETGRIFEGLWHPEIHKVADEAGVNPNKRIDGFTTNSGEFLTREQAMTRAEEIGQIPAETEGSRKLETIQFEGERRFLPKEGEPLSTFGNRILEMSPDEWRAYTTSAGGLTGDAFRLGSKLTDPADLATLRTLEAGAVRRVNEARAAGDLDTLFPLATKKQYFTEAIQGAEGTGNERVMRQFLGEGYQPPFPTEATKGKFSAAPAEGPKFLPVEPKPDTGIRDLAGSYAKSAGLAYKPSPTYAPVNPELGRKLADFYESAKSNPSDPAVQASYKALSDETLAQLKSIQDAGYTLELFSGEGEPYKNSADAITDVRDNKHLFVLKTEGNFAGATDNPLLAPSGVDGLPTVNDVFRGVHDFFGHAKEGYQFGPRGEFNAWRAHSEMYSPAAQGALAAETLAQNSWVNFGKHLEGRDIPASERPFAEQKAVVMPQELIDEAKGQAEGKKRLTGGAHFAEFFDKTERTPGGGATIKNFRDTLELPTEGLEPQLAAYLKFGSNFQKHIAASIPGFVDARIRLMAGLEDFAKTRPEGEPITMLDITSSEGYFPKAWAESVQRDGRDARATTVDALPAFEESFHRTPQVPGVKFELAAWGEPFNDPTTGRDIPLFKPEGNYDIVHEGMGFQFFTPDRENALTEVKRILKPDGVFVTLEKFKNPDYAAREKLKDESKARFFSAEQLSAKAKEVLTPQNPNGVGMSDFQFDRAAYEKILASKWKHVEQVWSSGNFAGYVASDSPAAVRTVVDRMGSTDTRFSHEATPRKISAAGEDIKFLPRTDAGRALEDAGFVIKPFGGVGNRGVEIFNADKDLIGEISSAQRGSDKSEISFVRVRQEEQGQGVGEALYRELADQLKEDGIKTVVGAVVAPGPLAIRRKVFGGFKEIKLNTEPTSYEDALAHAGFIAESGKNLAAEQLRLAKSRALDPGDLRRRQELLKTRGVRQEVALIEPVNEITPESQFLPADQFPKDVDPIDKPAIRTKAGQIFTGVIHGDAIDSLIEAVTTGVPTKGFEKFAAGRVSDELLDFVYSSNAPFVDGFVTLSGKFLSRQEAREHALEIGQLGAGSETAQTRKTGGLESELFRQEAKFLPRVKRDDQNRPLTKDGLVDYERLYKERAVQKKRADKEDVDLSKYDIPANQTELPGVGKTGTTGWILPDKSFIPLATAYHEQYLTENAAVLNKKFGTAFQEKREDFSPNADGGERLAALNKGFVRLRHEANGAALHVEANADAWRKLKPVVMNHLLENEGGIDNLNVSLLNKKGQVVDSIRERLFELEGAEKADKISEAVDSLRAGVKFLPQTYSWMSPSGEIHPVEKTHGADAQTRFKTPTAAEAIELAFSKGWLRIANQGEDLYVHTEAGQPSTKQFSRLTDLAQEAGKTRIVADLGESRRVLWTEEDMLPGAFLPGEETPGDGLTPTERNGFFTVRGMKARLKESRPDLTEEQIDREVKKFNDRAALFFEGKFLPREQSFTGFEPPTPEELAANRAKAKTAKIKANNPEAILPQYGRDEDGNLSVKPDGKPRPVAIEYDLINTPLAREAAKGLRGPAREEAIAEALGDRLAAAHKAAIKNPDLQAGSKWYSTARVRLKKLLGDDAKLFAELLGATSARTPVETNFRFALDAYNQFKAGEFDPKLAKYREGKQAWDTADVGDFIKATKNEDPTRGQFLDYWVTKFDLSPRQTNGKLYGPNSRAVLRVLDGSWQSEVKGPKTPNFAGNLSGDSFAATVDIWAARGLHRLANEGNPKRWRILPENETGVSNEDFYLGQAAYRHAAKKLGIRADSLQAILWFAEKDLWEKNGWTRGAGALKSDFNALLAETERTEGGALRKKEPQKELGFSLAPGDIIKKK